MIYLAEFKNNFLKELKILLKNNPQYKETIKEILSKIEENPFNKNPTLMHLRYRVGNIRIATSIQKNLKVITFKKIGFRNDFYKSL